MNFIIKKNHLAITLSSIIFGIFLFWTTTSSNAPAILTNKPVDYYNLLTEAFLHGQTSILKAPDPKLLSLANPYDPIANSQYRLHDLSLYNKKYYLYFGATPVITLLLPYALLTGTYLPINIACVLFVLLGYIFSCLTFLLLIKNTCKNINISYVLLYFLVFAFAIQSPILLRWANIYELAIVSGYAYSMIGLYCCVYYITSDNFNVYHLALGSLCYGLSIGCRPNLVFPSLVILIGVYGFLILRHKNIYGSNDKYWIKVFFYKEGLAAALPLCICILILLKYNKIRFNSYFEFGQHYILAGPANKQIELGYAFHLKGAIETLKYYLVEPISFVRQFPFVTSNIRNLELSAKAFTSRDFQVEPIFGILYTAPIFILGLIFPIINHKIFKFGKPLNIFLTSIYLSSIVTCILIASLGWVTARYSVDFTPCLLLLSPVHQPGR